MVPLMASVLLDLLCLLLLLIPVSTLAQTPGNVTLESSLSIHDENPFWTSPSGEFAFGFHLLAGEKAFLLAIWFHKIPSRTIVWTANKEDEAVQGGSRVEVTAGGIILNDNQGNEIWSARPIDNSRATSASMLNTGNFVLRSDQSTFIWDSFENPTDTILPTQILNQGSRLSSRLSEDDYSAGRFELRLQDGNLVSYTIARPTDDTYVSYWASDTDGSNSQLIFNQTGYIYLDLRNGSLFNLTKASPGSVRNFYHKATLDSDGVFRQYTYPKTSPDDGRWPESWSVLWSVPEDICMAIRGNYGSGACGFNSYCSLDQEQRPKCECPPGYIPLDPNNTFKGCKQNFTQQSCEMDVSGVADGFRMVEIPNTDWPESDFEWFKSVNEDFCRETCLKDCFCAVSIIRGNNCWKKKFPLFNGRMDPSVGGKALVKVGSSSQPDLPPIPDKNKNDREAWILPGSIFLGSSASLNCLLLLAICLLVFGSNNKRPWKTFPHSSTLGMNLRSFTYEELEEATHGFKEELGKGGFSIVYKGTLELDSSILVAIKKLDMVVEECDREFKNEVSAIGRTNHKNLVQLLGYCDEGPHRLLVYELMTNGSLAGFLFGNIRPNWYQRIQIAFGIARGLAYLHDECITQIIHCDVKPQNILLDGSFVARIADFGLAKLLKADQTQTRTGIRGTRGYVAPEWFQNKAITAKVDVYSFGVMLLEIICCRKNAKSVVEGENKEILSEWAYDCYTEGKLYLLVENDEDARNDGRRLERFIMVAIWCIQEDPSLRPSMKKVTQMLEGAVEVPIPPDPFSFISTIY